MPATTGQGITYPVSTDTVHLTDDLATLATSIDTQLSLDRTTRDSAWAPFTPTILGATSGGTIGNGTLTCRYKQYGRLVVARYKILLGSTSSFGVGTLLISLPVTSQTAIDNHIGSAVCLDASPVARYPGGSCEINTNADFIVISGAGGASAAQAGAIVTASAPITWTTGDELRCEIVYEAASA